MAKHRKMIHSMITWIFFILFITQVISAERILTNENLTESVYDRNIALFENEPTNVIKFQNFKVLKTVWIVNNDYKSKVRYGFVFDVPDGIKVKYTAELIADNDYHKEIDSAEFETAHHYEASIEEHITNYRIQFSFHAPSSVQMTDVYLNDPCNTAFNPKPCNPVGTQELTRIVQEQEDKDGKYNRKYRSFCYCRCNDAHEGQQCEIINHCNADPGTSNGKVVCPGGGHCENRPGALSYSCTGCPKDYGWDMNNHECARINCPEHQEVTGSSSGLECACYSGKFWNGNSCQKFDACDNAHRAFLKGGNFSCPINSFCRPIDDFRIAPLGAYQCVCKDGYFNQRGIMTPGNASCAPLKILDVISCPQGRNDNDDSCACAPGYEQPGCKPDVNTLKLIEKLQCHGGFEVKPYIKDGKCVCQTGFSFQRTIFDSKIRECLVDPKSPRIEENLGCDEVRIDDDGLLYCVCWAHKHLTLDAHGRSCVSDSYGTEIWECKQDQKGQFDRATKTCKCAKTDLMYRTNETDWQCVDKCVALNRINDGQYRCNKAFSVCDSSKVLYDAQKLFVESESMIQSTNELGGEKSHCFCHKGFSHQVDTNSCIQKEDSTSYQVSVEILINESPLEPERIEESTILWNAVIQQMFEISSTTKCAEEKELLICRTLFMLSGSRQLSKDDVFGVIYERSLRFMTNGWHGFAVKLNGNETKLIQYIQRSLKVSEENYCDHDPCRDYPNSQCAIVPETHSVVECRCPDLFEVDKNLPRRSANIEGKPVIYESCKPNDLCAMAEYKCQDETARCNNILINNGTMSIPDVICTCNIGFRLSSRDDFCNDCDDCNKDGTTECGKANGHGVCKCKADWIGDKCERKLPPKML